MACICHRPGLAAQRLHEPARRATHKLRRQFRKQGLDALLVTNFTNVTYLTGFTGDDSYLLVLDKGEVVVSDPRYTTQLDEECPAMEASIRPPGVGMVERIAQIAQRAKVGKLGIEGASMTVAARDEIAAALPKAELVSTTDLVEDLRVIKDKDEVAEIRRAVWYAERAFGMLRASLAAGADREGSGRRVGKQHSAVRRQGVQLSVDRGGGAARGAAACAADRAN